MGEMKPIMRPSDIRRAVTEWATQGFAVRVDPDGTITITQPARRNPGGHQCRSASN